MITCIIFDCDGTLVDSEWICNEALRLKLQPLDIDITTLELVER